METQDRLVAQGLGEGNRSDCQGQEVSLWDDENAVELDSGNGCTTL